MEKSFRAKGFNFQAQGFCELESSIWGCGDLANHLAVVFSNDGGENYTVLHEFPASASMASPIITFTDKMTGFLSFNVFADGSRLCRTSDGGTTWQQVLTTGKLGGMVPSIVGIIANEQNIVVEGECVGEKWNIESHDGGKSWESWMYVAGNRRNVETHDAGQTWRLIAVRPQSPPGTVESRPRVAPPAQPASREAMTYYWRGETDYQIGDFDKAIADCSKAIELDPALAKAYYYRGRAFNGKGDFEKAIADYSKAIELDPKDYEGYYNRGFSYYANKDYDKAIADWSKAIELRPDNPWPYLYRGLAYSDKEDYDKAWADVKKCQTLGGTVDQKDLDKLRKASGRSE
jgi:Tfp pilus assembly protein PilF